MQVQDIMTPVVEMISSEENLHDAAGKMRNADVGALPVVTADGTVVGMLTDRDIVIRAIAEGRDPKAVCAGDVMTADPVTCRPDCPLEAAADTMRDRRICRLLVTEEHDRNVMGVVSLGDIAARAHETALAGEISEVVAHPS
jgi:CBS domain-containing protein